MRMKRVLGQLFFVHIIISISYAMDHDADTSWSLPGCPFITTCVQQAGSDHPIEDRILHNHIASHCMLAVCDGHGNPNGQLCAELLTKHLPKKLSYYLENPAAPEPHSKPYLEDAYTDYNDPMQKIITAATLAAHEECVQEMSLSKDLDKSDRMPGTTVVFSLTPQDGPPAEKTIYSAWVGDSGMIQWCAAHKQILHLTPPHKPVSKELERIEKHVKAGAKISTSREHVFDRIHGIRLGMTREIGGHFYATPDTTIASIIPTPSIIKHTLSAHDILVHFTDGLVDEISARTFHECDPLAFRREAEKQIGEVLCEQLELNHGDYDDAARALVDYASNAWQSYSETYLPKETVYKDDISTIISVYDPEGTLKRDMKLLQPPVGSTLGK